MMTAIHCTNVAPMKASAKQARALSPLTSPLAWLANAIATRHQRNSLRDLDDAALRDIGVTRDQARREADKPLWDVPSHWQY